jgi:hypothetical protein
MYKMLCVSSKVQMLTLLESSWFSIKASGSCVIYFGIWLGVTLCRGMFLAVLCTKTSSFHKFSV